MLVSTTNIILKKLIQQTCLRVIVYKKPRGSPFPFIIVSEHTLTGLFFYIVYFKVMFAKGKFMNDVTRGCEVSFLNLLETNRLGEVVKKRILPRRRNDLSKFLMAWKLICSFFINVAPRVFPFKK